jgi:hypothetical protein
LIAIVGLRPSKAHFPNIIMSGPVLLAAGVASLAVGVALSDGIRAAAGNVPVLAGVLSALSGSPFPSRPSTLTADQLPPQALLMLPSQFAALESVLPPSEANATTVSSTSKSMDGWMDGRRKDE